LVSITETETTKEIEEYERYTSTNAFKKWIEANDLTRLELHIDWKTYGLFGKKVKSIFKKNNKRSYALRILVHAWIEGLIDIKELEQKLQSSEKEFFVGVS
jgi:hypothetical protein